MRKRWHSASLTTRFALVSLVAFVVMGVGLTAAVQSLLRDQGLADAKQRAQVVADLATVQGLGGADRSTYRSALSPERGERIDALIASSRPTVRNVRLWASDGTLLYSSDRLVEHVQGADSAAFSAAVRGSVGTQVDTDPSHAPGLGGPARVVEVFVPLELDDLVAGVAQVTVPYDQLETQVASAGRTVALGIVVGLVLVWLLLFRLVHRASRRLHSQAAENAELALHDPLTGLPNRRLLAERLDEAALRSARTGGRVGLLLLDVDRFKEVNDTLGHEHGDHLLDQVADRLVRAVRSTDTVARLGGDEFAILLPEIADVAEAEALGHRVTRAFDESFELEGLDLHVDASIGVAVLPDHADDVTTMMQRADIAMYVAKAAHSGLSVYAADSDAHNKERLQLLGDLRRAIDSEDELQVHYQPKVSLSSGEVVGLEALLRWNHPLHGRVMPDTFVPLAERTGLIHPLTRRVLELVVRQLAEWDRDGREVPVAVNLSGRNLNEPGFVDYVLGLLDEHAVHPCLLELEITESAMIEDPVGAREVLNQLASLGLQIAVDDFGTGYTSMAQLESLPLRTLKIDRSFVWRMLDDPGGAVLVKAIIDLAHEFNLVVVAEGVEQESMLVELRRLGCDVAQGFHWSAAVPGAEVHDVLDRICVSRGRATAVLK